jgi:hypothetical protein
MISIIRECYNIYLKDKIKELQRMFIKKEINKKLIEKQIILAPSCGFGSCPYSEKDA